MRGATEHFYRLVDRSNGAGRTAPAATGTSRRADDGSRTRDLELGKLALYQLSYVREGPGF